MAIRTHRYQYIRNFKPERNPTSSDENLVRYKDHPEYSRFYRLVHGKRPAEELYDMTNDPWQVDNLASDPCHEEAKRILAERLEQHLRDTGDPRMIDGEFPYGDLEMDRRNWARRHSERHPGMMCERRTQGQRPTNPSSRSTSGSNL